MDCQLTADQHRCQQRQRQLMMPRDRKALPRAIGSGPSHDVCRWPITLDEIEIGGRDVSKLMSQIPYDRDCLKEYLGQHDSRTVIDINAAAVHLSHKRTNQSKISVRCLTQRRAVA